MTPPPPYPQAHGLLRDQIVVITAAAGAGIGGATARRALEEGAKVLISDAHERRLNATLAELEKEFGADRVAALPCDVTSEEQVRALYALAVERYGRIDVAVNNAGLGGTSDLVDMEDDAWDRVLDITLNGTMRCTRAALRIMREQGSGKIVNNASVIGWRAQKGQSHYAAAKAGVMALTRCAALEAAEYGVRINAVSPSLAMHPHLVKVTSQELLDDLTSREAFGRYAEPWEVANVIVFLASDYSSYMTGEVLSVSSQHP
ncbi:SDR family oxidoreductase [Actinomadura sp. 9N407]|uniref:SDR family oxidoreductase n=1 Tax=Actinomadura sp. 9N407 TaxID=3375154 RepID=UPI0037A2BB67